MNPEKTTRHNVFYYIALVSSIWFLVSCPVWTYLANVYISFPFGLLSLWILNYGKSRDERKERYKIIYVILVIGSIVALGSLVYFLVFE
jgi:hypothetical protein